MGYLNTFDVEHGRSMRVHEMEKAPHRKPPASAHLLRIGHLASATLFLNAAFPRLFISKRTNLRGPL
jgi:hypothetical protein